MQVDDTLEFLLGRWSLVRTVTDHRSGPDGRFEGWADVREAAAGGGRCATYEEVGRFRLARHDDVARRRLRYRRRPDASLLVEFADGRPFVTVDLRDGHWSGRHDCGADRYDLTFLVRSYGTFEEHWRVRGPAKDYEARAVFVRETGQPAAVEHHGVAGQKRTGVAPLED